MQWIARVERIGNSAMSVERRFPISLHKVCTCSVINWLDQHDGTLLLSATSQTI